MNILLAVDGSEAAQRATEHLVASLLLRPPLSIHLVNVQAALPADVARFVAQADLDGLHRERGHSALEAATKALNTAGLSPEQHILVGTPAEEICALADRLGCAEIWMGRRGQGLLPELLLGSVSQKVLHLARQPVVLVR